jgi:8-oxo-dGTP pyrophosphatase MutT (NUDIX family)
MDIRVAAYGVIVRDGQILLAHWSENGQGGWTLPGGGIDGGEDPADAAVREIFEETGYTARLDRLIGIDNLVIPPEQRFSGATTPLQALRIIYTAHILHGELTNEQDGSTDRAEWFVLDDVAELHRVGLVDVALRFYRGLAG